MPTPPTNNPISAMPRDSSSLIAWLDRKYPVIMPSVEQMATQKGRLQVAREIGQRDLIETLKKLDARRKEA